MESRQVWIPQRPRTRGAETMPLVRRAGHWGTVARRAGRGWGKGGGRGRPGGVPAALAGGSGLAAGGRTWRGFWGSPRGRGGTGRPSAGDRGSGRIGQGGENGRQWQLVAGKPPTQRW